MELLAFGRCATPREFAFGAGERGVEKGCAALVDVAAGRSFGRGFVVAIVPGDTADAKDRVTVRDGRNEALRRHCLQIILELIISEMVLRG